MVQSLAGSFASNYFSREMGGKVSIGSIGCNPFNHLTLRNVELINPENDTICIAHTVALRFKHFPVDAQGLSLSRLRLKDTYYHFKMDSTGLNLKFIIDYFRSGKEKKTKSNSQFIVIVDDLIFDNVCYRQDLKERKNHTYGGVGVDIPHMEWSNITGRFRNVRVDVIGGPYVTCRIDDFATRERSGLEVKKMQMNVYVGPTGISATNMLLETDNSHLEGDVLLDYRSWHTMKHFLDSVYFNIYFNENSYGGMGDAGYWAPVLWGLKVKSALSGWFSGPLSDFYADNLHLAIGKNTNAILDGHLYGLPNIDTTIISGSIHRLHVTYDDWVTSGLNADFMTQLGGLFEKMDYADVSGVFNGTIHDLAAKVDVTTRQGDVNVDCNVANLGKNKLNNNEVRYSGHLSSDGFALGELAPNEWLSKGAFDIVFDGRGLEPQTMKASAQGRLHHLVLRGQHLANGGKINITVADSTAQADFEVDDPSVALSAQATLAWRGVGPSYRAELHTKHLDLKRLKLWNDTSDHEAIISFDVSGRYITTSETRNYARVTLENLHLNTTNKVYKLKKADITAREHNKWRNVTLNSDIMTAQMRGYFELDGFGLMWHKFADDYIPQIPVTNSNHQKQTHDYDRIAGALFELDMEWNDSTGVLQTFLPQLTVARGTTLQTNYNFTESFKPLIRSDSLGWGNMRLYNVGASGESIGDSYRLRVTTDEVKTGSIVLSDYSDLSVESSSRDASIRLQWENSDVAIGGGDLRARLVDDIVDSRSVIRAVVDPSSLELGGHQWQLNGSAMLPDGIFREAHLILESNNQNLTFNAIRQGRNDDEIEIRATDFDLNIIDPLLSSKGMTLTGIANGSVNVGGLNEVPYLNANLLVNALAFNGEELGDARLRSTWNAEMNQLNIYLNTENTLQLAGYVSLGDEDPELDFDATLDDVALKVLQPFIGSFSSRIDGAVSADLSIHGTVGQPLLQGFVFIDSAYMLVDFLNVNYSFSDTVYVNNNEVTLDNFIIRDQKGGEAVTDGKIILNSLDDIEIDLKTQSNHFLCMNTTSRQAQSYYGTIIASLQGKVSGKLDDIDIQIDARTLQGSELNIPISNQKNVKTADYIYFVGQDYELPLELNDNIVMDQPLSLTSLSSETSGKYQLTINIEGTPDLQLFIPMNTTSIDVDVKARGQGDLQMQLSTDMPFTLRGDYELNSGSTMLNILGLRSWDFSIDEGSTITFPGEINDALFDIKAVYSQRVNMVTLTGSLAANENQKQINVENVIQLSGSIDNPSIGFDIRLPNADQSVQEEVFAYIDRTNERDMLNQTISLLLFNRFYNSSTSTLEESTSVAGEGYGIVANSLGSLVSGMVQFVDLNFEYKAGNALTTEQYALDISKEWNKFYFETTVGFGGEAREISDVSTNNNMTGDMLVGYKINPRLHLFVFNRSNTNDYTRSDLPYKQGVGLKYTRDFDNFKDLFNKK